MNDISYPVALAAGFASFLSPCVFPLIPSYISFITGLSYEELSGDSDRAAIRKLAAMNALVFILGFSTVFVSLGTSSSYIGGLLAKYQSVISKAGGAFIIIFGLYITGLLKVDFLSMEKKIHLQGRPAGYLGAFLVGITFAAGWTPCIGPILGSILLYASTAQSAFYGFKLLTVYSLGLAIPFFIVAVAFNSLISALPRFNRHIRAVSIASGVLMIAFGIVLLTDSMHVLQGMMPDLGVKF